jgi:hypothetical protein
VPKKYTFQYLGSMLQRGGDIDEDVWNRRGCSPTGYILKCKKKLFTSDKLGKKVTTKLLGSSHMPIIR